MGPLTWHHTKTNKQMSWDIVMRGHDNQGVLKRNLRGKYCNRGGKEPNNSVTWENMSHWRLLTAQMLLLRCRKVYFSWLFTHNIINYSITKTLWRDQVKTLMLRCSNLILQQINIKFQYHKVSQYRIWLQFLCSVLLRWSPTAHITARRHSLDDSRVVRVSLIRTLIWGNGRFWSITVI